ncbi:colicin V production protein [Candidatus Nanopelagicus hibericus]|uniref:Colicin V production protein n=1 Tax=Candidatus Nanopelagicus hibericus TaxID=1884915 RepID=A0A249KAT2_9ACTN|nr:CvpA family protein [Candidatus Nanopelagicus hibericus]ASY13815.1 colicin V production protein [Candidatus Nanopelagicus hibericus]
MNYFDLLIVLVLLIAFYSGYKNGLIKTIFRTAGYIAGGVAGLALAVKYLATWDSQSQKVVLALLAVFVGASIGDFLLGKIGSLFRKILFVPPFKLIDSLVGAAISTLRAAFILYLVATLLVFSTWGIADKYIKPSELYDYVDSHLPSVMNEVKSEIVKLLEKVN